MVKESKQTNRAAAESVPAEPNVDKKDLNGKPLKSPKIKLTPILSINSLYLVRLDNIQYSYLAEFSVPIF